MEMEAASALIVQKILANVARIMHGKTKIHGRKLSLDNF